MSRANNRVEPTAEKFIFEESMTSEEKGTLRNLIGLGDAAALNTTSDGKTNPTLILKTDANGAVTVTDVTTDTLSFNTTNGAPQNLGELAWFQDEETLSLLLKGGTLLELGEETLYHVENNTGTTIAKGVPVMYAGTVGSSGKLRVKPWDGTDPKAFMGIATMAITGAEGTGYVTHFGKLKGIQTDGANYGQSWASGNIIYAVTGSANLTNVAPSEGGFVTVAVVISSHSSNGTLFIRPTQVPSLTDLGAAAAVHTHVSDDITDATDSAEGGKIAKYTSTSGLFSLGLELYNGASTTDLAPESGSANHTITVPAADGTMALTSDIPSTGTIAAQDADNVAITGGSLSGVTVNNYTKGVVAIGTVGASHTINLTSGTFQTATLTASTASTFTMPTATAGKSFTLLLKQAATTGNGTATFTGVKWDENGTPTITATAGKMDILTFTADGTNWYGSIIQGFTP